MDNKDGKRKIEVHSTHSAEMLDDEIKSMLGVSGLNLTLGHIIGLHLIRSPYVEGGDITVADAEQAKRILHMDMDVEEFNKALIHEIETAFRVYEIIQPPRETSGESSRIDTFSPEWMSDVISMASTALPSMTYHQAFWEMPFVMLVHLSISASRQHGTITQRPDDIAGAIRDFKKMRESKNVD